MATTYLTPGVYVEEVPSGSATLAPGATAVAAFVGFTAKGPRDDPPTRSARSRGWCPTGPSSSSSTAASRPGAMLPHAVYGYFNNGGALAYIVRIPHTEPATESGTLALPSADRTLGPAVEITTVEPNADIVVTVTPEPPADDADDAPPTFRVDVTEDGGSEPVETLLRPDAHQGRPQHRDRRQQGVDEGQGGDEDRHLEARGRPRQPARRQLRHRAGAADAGRRARPGVRRLARPPARASTASSSPRTSRW